MVAGSFRPITVNGTLAEFRIPCREARGTRYSRKLHKLPVGKDTAER